MVSDPLNAPLKMFVFVMAQIKNAPNATAPAMSKKVEYFASKVGRSISDRHVEPFDHHLDAVSERRMPGHSVPSGPIGRIEPAHTISTKCLALAGLLIARRFCPEVNRKQ